MLTQVDAEGERGAQDSRINHIVIFLWTKSTGNTDRRSKARSVPRSTLACSLEKHRHAENVIARAKVQDSEQQAIKSVV